MVSLGRGTEHLSTSHMAAKKHINEASSFIVLSKMFVEQEWAVSSASDHLDIGSQ